MVHVVCICNAALSFVNLENTADGQATSTYGMHHVKTCLWEYEDSESPDQSASVPSLIRAFSQLTESLESKGQSYILGIGRMM